MNPQRMKEIIGTGLVFLELALSCEYVHLKTVIDDKHFRVKLHFLSSTKNDYVPFYRETFQKDGQTCSAVHVPGVYLAVYETCNFYKVQSYNYHFYCILYYSYPVWRVSTYIEHACGI